jgi:hypothetical protein
MSIKYATKGEAAVARNLVKIALDAGYTISVFDGGEWTVKHSSAPKTIIDALATADEDFLRIRNKAGESCGWFSLIWGNADDGSELISDHADNDACNGLISKMGYYA